MRILRLLPLTLLALAVAMPAAARIRADFDPEADFTGRRTFAFKTGEGPAKFKEDEPFLDKYLRSALQAELTAKGLQLAQDGASADLVIAYRAAVQQRLDVYDDPDWFPRRGWCDDVEVRSYDEVTYSVDVIDGRTKELMWRGWASEPQAPEGKTRRQVERLIAKLLRKYPPRP